MPPKRKVLDDEDEYVDEGDHDEEFDRGNRRKGKSLGGGLKSRTSLAKLNSHSSNDALDDTFIFQDYSKALQLKPDHEKRPIWITNDNMIFLEAFSPLYQQAYDFLVAIAEPESRPEYIHTYKLTENSLYAAVAVSIDTESIIKVLNRLCKTDVPVAVITYIRECTYTFGKAKIVLKDNKYFVESQYPEILRELLKNPNIRKFRVVEQGSDGSGSNSEFVQDIAPVEDSRNLDYTKLGMETLANGEDDDDDDDDAGGAGGGGDSDPYGSTTVVNSSSYAGRNNKRQTVSFMISKDNRSVQDVKRSAKEESKYPLMEEYDFKNDHKNPLLTFDLRPSTRIRSYQEKSLSKMFGNGRARSGIIVLPCGAGKSLTGVTAATTIKRASMVICINNASVKQWKEQFLMFTNIAERHIKLFTSGNKETLPPKEEACIVITTYSMICHGGRRSAGGEQMIRSVREREWGLMILDEVHVAPADMFQKVVQLVDAHCKLGLTATLVREDNKIKDLSFLVGPKLYEANWIDLTADGYLARVQCVEVWCPMTKEFFAEYIKRSVGTNSRLQRLLYTLNPRKFRTCEYLVKYHTKRGDKIIIFSDDVPALILYCEALKQVQEIPYIYGGTKENDRRDILTAFKTRSELSCIGLSKVGDTALDIPEANVIIQISSHFGARRQEAQRLGRILRPKNNPTGGFNAFFYTLISTDTREMYFSTKRQQYLIDQGYTFKVQQDLADRADAESTLLKLKSQEIDLLNKVIAFNCDSYDQVEDREVARKNQGEYDEGDEDLYNLPASSASMGNLMGVGGSMEDTSAFDARRKVTKLSAMSGVGSSVYDFDS